MAIGPGARIGPYEVTSLLGEGGMGKVWRAHHTGLKRDDALKVLPDAFASDPERLARFQREAQVLASLNHPNIAHVYGLEESDGTKALVMELVEGPTLADRIAKGPIPIDEALPIARQIAEALEAAHEQGIVHRDLKPANIKLRADGSVKVLDFGLAKVMEPVSAISAGLSQSPTITTPAVTHPGVILGTAAYMSPEQARGKVVDKRADVWAFGCVLYEMLTGRAAFRGETVSDTIAGILERQPDWQALPTATPPSVRHLLPLCLSKDPRQRVHDIADVRLEIQSASNEPGPEIQSQRTSKRIWLIASVFVVAIAAMAFIAGRRVSNRTSDGSMVWSSILPPARPFKDFTPRPTLAPDGRALAFKAPNDAGQNVIWVRPLDSPTPHALPGTESRAGNLFWSPDGRSLGFFADGKLKRVDVAGGAPQILADVPDPRGGSWARDGTILFVPDAKTVHRIPASGGSSVEVTHLNADRHELIHGFPHFLPDDTHFLVWVLSSERRHEGVYIGILDTGELRPLLPLRTRAEYARGYLFFGRQESLWAQRFDPVTLQLSGDATRVTDGLGLAEGELANLAFSVSSAGDIAWWSETPFPKVQPTWFDRAGNTAGTIGESGRYMGLMPSPDGQYAATERIDLQTLTGDIWLLDLGGGNPSRLTFVGYAAGNPVWSPDSQRVLFTQWRDYLDVVSIHGSAAEQIPFPGGGNSDYPLSWSPDGQNLLLARATPETRFDLWIFPMSGDRKPRPYLMTPIAEFAGRISPNGRWVAYASNESGRTEIFVQSFPVPGSKKRISTSGGTGPMWRTDGRELYFIAADQTLMAVTVSPGITSMEFSSPTHLFKTQTVVGAVGQRPTYAPSRDGKRFLFLVPVESDRLQGIHLIHNWRP